MCLCADAQLRLLSDGYFPMPKPAIERGKNGAVTHRKKNPQPALESWQAFLFFMSNEHPRGNSRIFYSYRILILNRSLFIMRPNQAKAIPEAEWNQHQDEIIDLFSTGTMETLRQKMEERGFSAT
jgi:hypothetical protein